MCVELVPSLPLNLEPHQNRKLDTWLMLWYLARATNRALDTKARKTLHQHQIVRAKACHKMFGCCLSKLDDEILLSHFGNYI